MIISRGRGYVFVHIPKTGGTALTLALEARAMKDDILIGDTPKARARRGRLTALTPAGRLWKHSRLADIEGIVARGELAEFRIVTLVRNPWDRAVSLYHWLGTQRFGHPAVALAQSLPFGEFIAHPAIRTMFRASPARSYLSDGAGAERPALIARIEHAGSDLAPFESHLGFRLTPLPRANESPRGRDWRGYFTDRTAAIVAEDCAEDIARFGYGFDPPPPA
jgi:hypothetical protein